MQLGDLQTQGLLLLLALAGLIVPVDKGHRLVDSHLFPLAPGHIHNPLPAGEHLLLADDQSIRLDAVVEGVAVYIGGNKGVLEGLPHAENGIQDQRPGKQGDDKGDKGSSLFHSVLSFCPLAGGWMGPGGSQLSGAVRGMGRSGTMVDIACL